MTHDPHRRRRFAASYALSLVLHALALVVALLLVFESGGDIDEIGSPANVTLVHEEVATARPVRPEQMRSSSQMPPRSRPLPTPKPVVVTRSAPRNTEAVQPQHELARNVAHAEPQARQKRHPQLNPVKAPLNPVKAPRPVPVATVQPPAKIALAPPSLSLNGAPSPILAPAVPEALPSVAPVTEPTQAPTFSPTRIPTSSPTAAPTLAPTAAPTLAPTAAPTLAPTAAPTLAPTAVPTLAPTAAPTLVPTAAPKLAPTAAPTVMASAVPIPRPSPSPVPTAARALTEPALPAPQPAKVAAQSAPSSMPAARPQPAANAPRPSASANPRAQNATAQAGGSSRLAAAAGSAKTNGAGSARPSASGSPAGAAGSAADGAKHGPAGAAQGLANLNDRLKNLTPGGDVDYSPKRIKIGDAQSVIDSALSAYDAGLAPPADILRRTFGFIYERRTSAHPDSVAYVFDTYAIGPITVCKAWKIVEHPNQSVPEVGSVARNAGIGGAVMTNNNSPNIRHDNGGRAEASIVQFPCSPKSYTAVTPGSITTPLPRHPDLIASPAPSPSLAP